MRISKEAEEKLCGLMARPFTTIGMTSITVTIIVIIVVTAIGVLVITNPPNPEDSARSLTTRTQTASSNNSTESTTANDNIVGSYGGPLAGELFAHFTSCSFASGVCTVTIVNYSTTPLMLKACDITGISSVEVTTSTSTITSGIATTTFIAFENGSTKTVVSPSTSATSIGSVTTVTGTVETYLAVNGTIGGPATAGIAANSQVIATCAVPPSQFVSPPENSIVSGGFTVILGNSAEGFSAGTETNVSFEGTWS
jgi:hypothetical protein